MLLKLFVFLLLVLQILGINFPFTLPGSKYWPNSAEFFKLRSKINGDVYFKGETGYNPFTYNNITNTPKPAVIIYPIQPQDIIEALKFAKKYNIRVSVQSTGHHMDHRNIYDNSVHIVTNKMNSKRINLKEQTVTLGAGNDFTQVQKYIAEETNKSLIVLNGHCSNIGVYGWTIGGGVGWLTKQHGLGVDTLVSIDFILANFSMVTASERENQDLFRALRGSGGGAYGIAVSL